MQTYCSVLFLSCILKYPSWHSLQRMVDDNGQNYEQGAFMQPGTDGCCWNPISHFLHSSLLIHSRQWCEQGSQKYSSFIYYPRGHLLTALDRIYSIEINTKTQVIIFIAKKIFNFNLIFLLKITENYA